MDVWYLPFRLSACYDSFQVAQGRNRGSEKTICETSLQTDMKLIPPLEAIMQIKSGEMLYIEGHGKIGGSDMIFEHSNTPDGVFGPRNEYMDAFRLARSLKRYGFKGGPIRLAVCYSANTNGFGYHLAKAMRLYNIAFKSIEGRSGEALKLNGTGGEWLPVRT